MKVYVVLADWWDDAWVVGVYASEESAAQRVKDYPTDHGEWPKPHNVWYDEWEVK